MNELLENPIFIIITSIAAVVIIVGYIWTVKKRGDAQDGKDRNS